ncbi:MAG: hypothetical protein LBL18_04065, partial [Bacteroidales bacterium]|nr:hypothetical protein [Bacteroidales bacterium]
MSDIGKFFQKNLAEKEIKPSETLWRKISQTTELMHFNKIQRIKRTIAYSLSGVVVAIIVATILWLSWPAQDKITILQKPALSTDKLPQPASELATASNLSAESTSLQITDNQNEANNAVASPPATSAPATQLPIHSVAPALAASTVSAPNTAASASKSVSNSDHKFESATSAKNNHMAPNKTTEKSTAT